MLRLPPRLATAEADLALPFQQAALQSTAQHDRFFANVRVRFEVPQAGQPGEGGRVPPAVVSRLRLDFFGQGCCGGRQGLTASHWRVLGPKAKREFYMGLTFSAIDSASPGQVAIAAADSCPCLGLQVLR